MKFEENAMIIENHLKERGYFTMRKAVYILQQSVFFTAFRNWVFVRNVDTRKNYLLSGSAYEILSILRTPHDISSLIAQLKKKFIVDDNGKFTSDVCLFVSSLSRERLVQDLGDADAEADIEKKQQNIEATVRQQAMNDHRLLSVSLELTYRCNEHCVHCYLDDPSEIRKAKELSADNWIRVIDECASIGCMNVLVTGGEPTLHPGFIDICQHVVDKGLLLNVYTNGLEIKDDIFDALCAMKLNSVSVSLYGGYPAFHDSITRIPGSFTKTLMTALKFKCAGKDTFIKTVVFRSHVDDYIQLKRLGKRIGMTVSPAPVITAGHSGKSNLDLAITDSEFRKLLHEERSCSDKGDCVEGRDSEGPVCMAGQNMLSFDPYGNIFPCNAVQEIVGDIHKSPINDVWENSKKLKWIRAIRMSDLNAACQSCDSLKVCTCCLGAALSENGGRLGLFMPACRQAKIRHEEWKTRISSARADNQEP